MSFFLLDFWLFWSRSRLHLLIKLDQEGQNNDKYNSAIDRGRYEGAYISEDTQDICKIPKTLGHIFLDKESGPPGDTFEGGEH